MKNYEKLSGYFNEFEKMVITDYDGFITDYTKENYPDFMDDEIFEITKAEGKILYVQLFVTGCQKHDTQPRQRAGRTSRTGRTGRKEGR